MTKDEHVVELLSQLRRTGFTGFIRINYSQGGITEIEKNEKILRKPAAKKQ